MGGLYVGHEYHIKLITYILVTKRVWFVPHAKLPIKYDSEFFSTEFADKI